MTLEKSGNRWAPFQNYAGDSRDTILIFLTA